MTIEELQQAGLDIVLGKNINKDRSINFLDRTIYHVVDEDYPDGKKRPELRVYRLAGSYLSDKSMEEALKVEENFSELNRVLREGMEKQGIQWKRDEKDMKALSIAGGYN